jgi:prepilin-type N-terminal cleavage/methylation domain-containing protein
MWNINKILPRVAGFYIKLRNNFVKLSIRAAKPRFIKFLTCRQKFYRGFTLLEVMVSLAILATAFTAVLKLHSDSMEMVISSQAHTRGADLAQYKMIEIEIAGLKNLPFMSGEFGEFAPGYSWNINIEPTSIKLWTKVTVTVSNRNIGKGGEFRLTEYMLPSGPEKRNP